MVIRNEQTNGSNNYQLTAFGFHKREGGVDIKIIGSMEVRRVPGQPKYSMGLITVDGKVFSVQDLQVLAGLGPRKVSADSCIVLLEPDDDYSDFSKAIIVDDVSEMLLIAEENEGYSTVNAVSEGDGAVKKGNASERTRTSNRRFRRPELYPIELQTQ
jgi:chemotaxis signal transduction protein